MTGPASNTCYGVGQGNPPHLLAIRLHPWYVAHAPPCRRIRLQWRRARRTLRGIHHLLLVAHAGVLVGRRSLVLVAGRVGVGVERPGEAQCLSLRLSFLGWTSRGRRTRFNRVRARYFAPIIMKHNVAFMDEKSVVLLYYGRDCRFHGREVCSFAVLWKRLSLSWTRSV